MVGQSLSSDAVGTVRSLSRGRRFVAHEIGGEGDDSWPGDIRTLSLRKASCTVEEVGTSGDMVYCCK